jgi:hypothetical protein
MYRLTYAFRSTSNEARMERSAKWKEARAQTRERMGWFHLLWLKQPNQLLTPLDACVRMIRCNRSRVSPPDAADVSFAGAAPIGVDDVSGCVVAFAYLVR